MSNKWLDECIFLMGLVFRGMFNGWGSVGQIVGSGFSRGTWSNGRTTHLVEVFKCHRISAKRRKRQKRKRSPSSITCFTCHSHG